MNTRSVAVFLASVFVLALPAAAATKEPAGTKVASGPQFDIYVVHKETRPFAGTASTLGIYQSTVVVHHTRRHGRQRYGGRLEAIDADLLDPSMWQIGDYNDDGFDDYRAVAGISKQGCRTWATQTWLPERERFTFGAKITYLTDPSGKQVKSCASKGK